MTDVEARAERDARLTASDWMLATDSPLNGNEQARAREYRQRLRDVPSQPGFPDAIVWPDVPERDVPTVPSEPISL